MTRIAVVGATSGPGAALYLRLLEEGRDVIGIGRSPEHLERLKRAAPQPERAVLRRADLGSTEAIRAAVADCTIIVDCADPHYVPQLLAALPETAERFVTLSSTRYAGRRGEDVRRAEAAALAHVVPTTVLHSALIYGGWNDNTVTRIWRLVRLMPIVPLPEGGRALVQPIFVDDVVACLVAAIDRREPLNRAIVLAGRTPLSYADFVRACARAIGRRAVIAPLPLSMILGLSSLTRRLSVLPRIAEDEVRRLTENKDADIGDMIRVLGVTPRPLDVALRTLVARRKEKAPRSPDRGALA